MEVSKDLIEKMKKLSLEKEGKEMSDQDAYEAASNFTGFVELMYELGMKEAKRKARLKKEPEGFPVDGQYSCRVCGDRIDPETGWWDWYGQKCLLCQKAMKDGVIPTYICEHSDSYYSMWKLTSELKVRQPAIKKLIKEGRLHPREILNNEGKVHCYIFLKKENPELVEKNNPVRKSYDRYHKKRNERWAKKASKEWREEIRAKHKKLFKR
ncbi:MAG: hypothetical protein M3M85_00640 [bacterium]|nr:hypothetical protein [bacterium]